MRIGQTSIVVFVSKIIGAILGFIATVYFARLLGAEVLGIYAVIIAVAAWIRTPSTIGFGSATTKRVSEGNEPGEYLIAGLLIQLGLLILALVPIIVFQDFVETYVSGFEDYTTTSVIWFVILLIFSKKISGFVSATLKGTDLVHVAGLLNPVTITLQSILQILLVLLGYDLIGMLVGYALGLCITALIGLYYIPIRPASPDKSHFRSLFEFAKYSWLGGLKTRAFNDVDILILGIFVPQALIGIYSVAWSLSKFLDMFGTAVSQSVFPQISRVSAQETRESAAGFIEDAIAYGGLIVIPGLVGGLLLDERLLRIYGPEFTDGTTVLWLLLLSISLYTYFKQHLNALNAINKPDIAFRVNLVFISTNVLLNVILIWQLGWIGAAIASATAAFVGLLVSHLLLRQIITIAVPVSEISRQLIAAICMGAVVWSIQYSVERFEVIQHNFTIVLGLVTIGAAVYVAVLLIISSNFREIVSRNLPFNFPHA